MGAAVYNDLRLSLYMQSLHQLRFYASMYSYRELQIQDMFNVNRCDIFMSKTLNKTESPALTTATQV